MIQSRTYVRTAMLPSVAMRVCWFGLVVGLLGCGFEKPEDVEEQFRVGGEVAGMWDGAAVTLRLEATDVDELLTVDANEGFQFETPLDDGTSFTISVATSPTAHDCQVLDGAAVLAGGDYGDARIACSGPAVDVTLSVHTEWQFDPEILTHTVDLSLLAQEVSLTVRADEATAIRVDDAELPSGAPTDPRPLALGSNDLTVTVEAGSASRVFELTFDRGARAIVQGAYAKASNTGAADSFGESVAVSGDIMVVGAPGEDSSSNSINGPQDDNDADSAGAAYVFRRIGSTWEQSAYLKASNAEAGDRFGRHVAIDGTTIVVAATSEGGPTNNLTNAGAAYVFVMDPETELWQQEALLRPSDTGANQNFGQSVSVSGDAIAIGRSAAVYIFRRSGSVWVEEERVAGSETNEFEGFGASVSLEGDLLAIGAPGFGTGKAYVFRRSGGDWVEDQILRGTGSNDFFGFRVAASGTLVAAGAFFDSSGARGVNPPPTTTTADASGAVYVFSDGPGGWVQEAFIKASNSDEGDQFGYSLDLRGDVLAVGACLERGGGSGIGADEGDNTASTAGATYVFHRAGKEWVQHFYVKASNNEAGDAFCILGLTTDKMVAGAYGEDSDATGVGGSQGNVTETAGSGATYVIE